MDHSAQLYRNHKCPTCGVVLHGMGNQCKFCSRTHNSSDEFHATGIEAMKTQEQIVNYHNKMATLRVAVPYASSVAFAVIAASLIIFAPESRTMAANIVAGALLVLAAGIAGFTRFFAKFPGLEIRADTSSSSN